ncbi:twin-arginine translocase subunit TatB, partial [Escherichia coli]|nr:twin-arginine translocase subunit TatB [Escherichia coli]
LSPELKSSVEELKKAAQSVNRPYAKNTDSEPETVKTEPAAEKVEKAQESKVTAADKKAE